MYPVSATRLLDTPDHPKGLGLSAYTRDPLAIHHYAAPGLDFRKGQGRVDPPNPKRAFYQCSKAVPVHAARFANHQASNRVAAMKSGISIASSGL
jgi:hypothetical protein